MQPLADFFDSAEAGLGHVLVEALPEDVVVTFELAGDGGGTWTVKRFGPAVTVRTGSHATPDCRLSCQASDFQHMLAGHLSSRDGFLQGKLVVEGDVGLVLRLEKAVLRRLRHSTTA